MPIIVVIISVIVLLTLILYFKWNTFVALLVVAIGVGFAQKMPFLEIISSIKSGVGSTLSELALVLGLGAMLGALIAESGAANRITHVLIKSFGIKRVQLAVILAGFIVGIPIFYNVGFIMLIPIILSLAKTTKLPLLYIGIPMISALSVTHGFLPPHPAPTAIAEIYKADVSLTLVYGLIIAIPTVILAGWLFGKTFKTYFTELPKDIINIKIMPIEETPSFGISVFTALLPVLLMAFSAIAKLNISENSYAYELLSFVGDSVIALLIALLIAIYTLGIRMKKSMKSLSDTMSNAVKAIAMIVLIIAGGGAFKQVLLDSEISQYIVDTFEGTEISPLFLAWSIAAALRIALGSATVAALTAGGIAAPMIASGTVSPELLVLATGAGSLTCSQVNDTGFWMFKEYFNLSIAQTLRSWTVMETIVSVVGLVGCLVLDYFV